MFFPWKNVKFSRANSDCSIQKFTIECIRLYTKLTFPLCSLWRGMWEWRFRSSDS